MKKKTIRPKKCRVCKELFTPFSSLAKACSVTCSLKLINNEKVKEFNKETRRLKNGIKSLNDWIADAQVFFNRYIRLRDGELPCISCGRVKVEWTRGGEWDCGHYKSRGAFPELRFEELNAHKQCKSCNGGSAKFAKKGHTVGQDYEDNLIKKIGPENVEWLNGPHEPKKYTIEDLKELKKTYQDKIKAIEGKL